MIQLVSSLARGAIDVRWEALVQIHIIHHWFDVIHAIKWLIVEGAAWRLFLRVQILDALIELLLLFDQLLLIFLIIDDRFIDNFQFLAGTELALRLHAIQVTVSIRFF